MTDTLLHALKINHLSASPRQITQFSRYLALLKTWNNVFNLTTLTTQHDMVYLHLIDSLLAAPHLQGTRLLDVGSGCGMPGIPLAIWNPGLSFVLIDKNSKKTRFLTQVVAELGLTHVMVIHDRSENFHPDQGFDSIISRAFGTLRLFVETTQHLLQPTGVLLAMKGKYPQDELIDLPEGYKAQVTPLNIKGISVERHMVCLTRT
ncbi:MAG: hypothetical protein A3E85_04305 [Gammaproteobacteria bacterium RIFCSPHIGHO2_12_FULL_45_12]|nr:MAG: hypothetical protein A3E85_04305 [Gammaproteobacteria bacterium RIFCSPHIGHO2_12_FULL_45_12]